MKLNILVLMAGGSEAFESAGYLYPKNLVEIGGQPLVERVLSNLSCIHCCPSRFLCVLRRSESVKFHTASVIRLIAPEAIVVSVGEPTSGAACTALLAIEHIDGPTPLLVTNGDQILDTDLDAILTDFLRRDLDGGIAVFRDVHPRWSFVKCDASGMVVEATEKRPISHWATAGFYYFKHGSDFVSAAESMILKGASVNNLFYVCPAYNEMILRQKRIGVYEISKSCYLSLATPDGVERFEQLLAKQALTDRGAKTTVESTAIRQQ